MSLTYDFEGNLIVHSNTGPKPMPEDHPHKRKIAIEDALALLPVSQAPAILGKALKAAYGDEQAKAIIRCMI